MSLFPRTFADGFVPSLSRVSLGVAALGAMLRTFSNRRAASRIAELPDYLLTDIGLKRDDVHDALSADWCADPTYLLAISASGRRRIA